MMKLWEPYAGLLFRAVMCWINKSCSSELQVLNERHERDAPGARIWVHSSLFILFAQMLHPMIASHLWEKSLKPTAWPHDRLCTHFPSLSCCSAASRGRYCFQTHTVYKKLLSLWTLFKSVLTQLSFWFVLMLSPRQSRQKDANCFTPLHIPFTCSFSAW